MNEHPNNNTERNKYNGRYGLVYVRVSSKRQEKHGHGRETQEKRCLGDLESIEVPYEKTFADTYTGGGDFLERPAMREAIKHIKEHRERKYVLVFDDLKRFARDHDFHWVLRRLLSKLDVELRCLNYTFGDSPEDEYMERNFSAWNELDRKQNSRQVVNRMKGRLEMGYWPFRPKKGYKTSIRKGHGKIGVPNRQAPILKEALERFSRGHLPRKIDFCRFLIEKGLWRNRPPKQFLDQATALLSDCYHMGDIEYRPWGVARRKGKHQGIISAAVFDNNQKRLMPSAPTKRIRRNINPDFPARGLIRCTCGGNLTAAWSKGRSSRYGYYFCYNRTCPYYNKYVPAKLVESRFIAHMQQTALKPDVQPVIEVMFDRGWKQETANVVNRQAERHQHVLDIKAKIRDLANVARKASSDSVRRVYEMEIEEAAAELEEANSKPSETNDPAVPYRTALTKATQFLKEPYFAWQQVDTDEKHRLYAFVFDDKLIYDRESGYRTGEIPTAVTLFEEFATSNSANVDSSGITLNRIKAYLLRFWDYYQSSPAFREALDNAR